MWTLPRTGAGGGRIGVRPRKTCGSLTTGGRAETAPAPYDGPRPSEPTARRLSRTSVRSLPAPGTRWRESGDCSNTGTLRCANFPCPDPTFTSANRRLQHPGHRSRNGVFSRRPRDHHGRHRGSHFRPVGTPIPSQSTVSSCTCADTRVTVSNRARKPVATKWGGALGTR